MAFEVRHLDEITKEVHADGVVDQGLEDEE